MGQRLEEGQEWEEDGILQEAQIRLVPCGLGELRTAAVNPSAVEEVSAGTADTAVGLGVGAPGEDAHLEHWQASAQPFRIISMVGITAAICKLTAIYLLGFCMAGRPRY